MPFKTSSNFNDPAFAAAAGNIASACKYGIRTTGNDVTASDTAIDHVQRAIGYFERIPIGDRPIQHAICGLRVIARQAALSDDFADRARHLERHATAVLFAATPIIAELVRRGVSAEQVYFGMGSAVALFRHDDVLKPDRINVVSMLEAQLWLQFNRQEMAARGNPLFRAFAIDRSWKSPRNPDLPLQ